MASEPIRWLHLSDFHVGKDDYGQRRLFKYILEHVEERVASGAGPDMVFITGDVANAGRRTEYQGFRTGFLEPLLKAVGGECRARVFVVPGNHDVDTAAAGDSEVYGLPWSCPSCFDPTEAGCEGRRCLFDRFASFAQEDATCPDPASHWLFSEQGALALRIGVRGHAVGVLGLNSAWLSGGKSEKDRHKLSPGKAILETGLDGLGKCDIRLVIGHHPVDWLHDGETGPTRALMGKHKVVYLHGHAHKNETRGEYGTDYPFLAIQSGACFRAREHEIWVNGFLWCELDLAEQVVRIEPLKWAKQDQAWVVDTEALPTRYREPGTDRWVLPTPASLAAPRPVRAGPRGVPVKVSLAKLPSTSPDLFGRDKELAMLDVAWESPKTNIVSLVAWGGVGKTALVNVWLNRMQKDGYRGAERVFGWSFYSQGAAEGRQVSADQFIASALEWLGDPDPNKGSPWDKGERLAALAGKQRTLLILDGVEPLQNPPGPQGGKLKDPALRTLLRELGRHNPGLCIITTRLEVDDLKEFEGTSMKTLDLGNLSPDAGAELLGRLGVQGTHDELKRASSDFGGHALALALLGRYLVVVHKGDIRQRDKVPRLTDEKRQGAHARRVMESYERWFEGEPELDILHIIGLFDRPAERGAVEAVRAKPAIEELTSNLAKLSETEWHYAVNSLREARLLAPKDSNSPGAPGALDAHPLVREHFGERLKERNPAAWKEAHSRLFEFYKSAGKQLPETLEEMAPLYAAVAHGCQAGRHQEALDEVLWQRIRRREQHFSLRNLGAFGADLAALSSFFDETWSQPAAALRQNGKAWVLNSAGSALRALGRLAEAAEPTQAALDARIALKDWRNAAINAGNLSELHLTMGELRRALEYARQAVELADRSGIALEKMVQETVLADAQHLAGRLEESAALFREAEEMQKKRQPERPLLYSGQGYQYCDLLLEGGKWQEVLERGAQTLKWDTDEGWVLDIGLDNLSLGRAHLLAFIGGEEADPAQAKAHLDSAVAVLRESGHQDVLPRGLLERAELHRVQKQFGAGRRDLDEAMTLATRGGMRLYEADCHLEYARLHLGMGEKPKARESLDKAKGMIQEMGYHRRDREVEELEKQLAEKG